MARADRAEARAETAGVQVEQLKHILLEAETRLTEERAGKATAEAAFATALEAQTKAEAQASEAEQATQAVEAEAAKLRQAAEQAIRETEALRAVGRAASQAVDVDRLAIVASRIDEVQFRRLQEAERARKSLGLLARLKAAWHGE
jgi:hypothetical protein